ncbi:MAG: hypothetical protein ACKV2V_08380 [Blastocatellia bacterium]
MTLQTTDFFITPFAGMFMRFFKLAKFFGLMTSKALRAAGSLLMNSIARHGPRGFGFCR